MDDDKQVKDLANRNTIGRFLNRPIRPDDRDRDTFDLEKEFAKTAKNKSPLIPLVIAAFLVALAVGAWVASQFTEQASQKSSVSIGSFEDLKLKEIFDTARKNKKDLEALQAQMDELTQAANAHITALNQAGSSKADIASVNDNSGAQAKAILAQAAKQVAAERASLAAALAPLKAQAAEVQKKIDSYDDRIGQLNKKNQQVLDTQQRLFDLEKQKLTDQFEARLQSQTDDAVATLARVKQERDALVAALKAKQAEDIRKLILKYNPVIAEGPLQSWIAQDGASPPVAPLLTIPDPIAAQALISDALQADLATRVDRTKQLLTRLRAIPYENSVPPLLNTLDKAIADSLVSFNGYLTPLANHVAQLDGEIASRDAQIQELQSTIAGLQDQLATAIAATQASEAARAADQAAAQATLARWTGAVNDYVATLKEDGVFVDVRNPEDWMLVLKADRAKALSAAIDAQNAAVTKTAVAVNLATVRDGQNNSELGTITVESNASGAWVARLVKLYDSKRPFKPFDRVVLALPAKK